MNLNDPYGGETNPDKSCCNQSNRKAAIAISATMFSGIALFTIPPLVAKSLAALMNHNPSATYADTIVDWNSNTNYFIGCAVFGGLFGWIAITPFAAYGNNNLWNKLINQFDRRSLWLVPLLISGGLNGENMFEAASALTSWPVSIVYLLAAIATIIPGIGNIDAALHFAHTKLKEDWRYMKRGAHFVWNRLYQKCAFVFDWIAQCCYRSADNYYLSDKGNLLSDKNKLSLVRDICSGNFKNNLLYALDDIEKVVRLVLTHQEARDILKVLRQLKKMKDRSLLEIFSDSDDKLNGFKDFDVNDFKRAFIKTFYMHCVKVPSWKLQAEGVIAGVSLVFAMLGNWNVIGLTDQLICRVLGVETDSLGSDDFHPPFYTKIGSLPAYLVNADIWFYLFRNLLSGFLNIGQLNFKKVFAICLQLIPAAVLGLINAVVTYDNPEINPAEKLFFAFVAIMGNILLSRYGINNGLRDIYHAVNSSCIKKVLSYLCTAIDDPKLELIELLNQMRCQIDQSSGQDQNVSRFINHCVSRLDSVKDLDRFSRLSLFYSAFWGSDNADVISDENTGRLSIGDQSSIDFSQLDISDIATTFDNLLDESDEVPPPKSFWDYCCCWRRRRPRSQNGFNTNNHYVAVPGPNESFNNSLYQPIECL